MSGTSKLLASSSSFKTLVTSLKNAKKTCTVVEQCCGGLISTSIMAQPGASSVYFGGSVAYNTKRAKPLLLNDSDLHASLLSASSSSSTTEDSAEAYLQSKFSWTAKTSVAFCEALETDYAIAEGGAAGPTFGHSVQSGFSVVAIAGRQNGKVQVLKQEVIRSDHGRRTENMTLFANAAADLATEVIAEKEGLSFSDGSSVSEESHDESIQASKALLLDRATHLRSNETALAAMMNDDKTQYVLLKGSKVLVRATTSHLALLNKDDLDQVLQQYKADDAGRRTTFLGMLSNSLIDDHDKTPVFGIDIIAGVDSVIEDGSAILVDGSSFVDTRSSAPLFSVIENEIALHATALAEWQRRTRFCTSCGGETSFVDGGTRCLCTNCKTSSWPRQDPSMIAVISSRNGERVLLAHSARHPPKFHTVLAGFVEAGETFEAAVAREAFEETGIRIDEGSVQYVGSQPWPFPQSCMIGFTATADETAPLNVDTQELLSAQWFDKKDVLAASAVTGPVMQQAVARAALEKDPSLPLLIPPKGVIARRLIDKWLAGDM